MKIRLPKNPKHNIKAKHKKEDSTVSFWCEVRKNKQFNTVMGDFISASGYIIETDEQIKFDINETIVLPFKLGDSDEVSIDSINEEPLKGYEFKGYTKKRIEIS